MTCPLVFLRTQSWISIAVLLMSVAVPPRAYAVYATRDVAVGPAVLDALARDEVCVAEQDSRSLARMQHTQHPGHPCAGGEGELPEAAEFSEAGWTAERFQASSGVPQFGNASYTQVSSAEAASVVAELATATPDETPTGSKVPEPSTLVLLGAGMIATSSLSRVKRQPKNVLRIVVARLATALPHLPASV